MFAWLAALPAILQALFVILGLAVVLVVAILIIKTGITVSKDGKGFGFTVGHKKDAVKINPHTNCPNVKDILIMMNEVVRLVNERFHLIEKHKTKLQMSYADQKVEQMRQMLLKEYIDLYNSKKSLMTPDNMSIQTYRLILKDAQNGLRATLRTSFIDNGFDKMNEKEFNIFCEDKFNFVVSQFTEYISDNYFYDMYIGIEELKGTFEKVEHKIKDMFEDIYNHAREVAIDTNLRALEIDERLEHAIESAIGIPCLMPRGKEGIR